MASSRSVLSAAQAAEVLGVKVQSLYAYVSRGVIEKVPGPDPRTSYFDAVAIADLARRRRRPELSNPTGATVDVGIRTGVTAIDAQGPHYRGVLATKCATSMTFEAVAELLWESADQSNRVNWISDPAMVSLGRKVSALLPPNALLADQVRAIAAVIAASEPLRFDLRPASITASARALVAAIVDSLPQRRPGGTPRLLLGDDVVTGSIAGRLWLRVSPVRPEGNALAVLNAAMVLLADHELATSTFGVRVAASTRADPYACIAAGLGVVSGPLHGSASSAVHQLLVEASQPEGATAAVARRLRQGERIPGFGHPLYPDGDPRAEALLSILRASEPNARRLAVVDSVLRTVGRRAPMPANVDFALAAMAFTFLMAADACEVIFAIARMAGWIAHALEEYGESPLRYRVRGVPSGHVPDA